MTSLKMEIGRRRAAAGLIALLLLCLGGAWHVAAQPSAFGPPEATPAPEAAPAAPGDIALDDMDLVIQGMDLQAKIAQLMMVTMSGQQGPTSADLAFLQTYTPGVAVIRQALQPEQAVAYTTKLREVERRTGIPLLLGADLYELIKRDRGAPSAFVQAPSLLSIAAVDDDAITAKLGDMIGEHLKLMGFHLHLGPKLDLAPTISGAQGGIHHFGHDPEVAARATAVLLERMRAHTVEMMPMNFPGGGMNREDRGPAVLLTARDGLADGPMRPFAEAVQRGARILHVGNTLTPTIDPDPIPASISPVVLRDLLRIDLQYDGVIVAGPMDSEDVARQFDPANAALLALRNGADMVYWRGSDTQVMRAIDRIVQAVEEGLISESNINASLRRVLSLKEAMMQTPRETPTTKDAAALVRQKRFQELGYEVERRAITLVQNRNQTLPLIEGESTPVGITGVVGVEELYAGLEKDFKQITRQRITTAQHIGDIQTFEVERVSSRIRGLRTIVCVLTDDLRPRGQLELLQALREQGARVVLVLVGYPTHLPLLKEADAIILAYSEGVGGIGATLQAVAEVLKGEGALQILPAQEELKLSVGEERVYDALDVVRAPVGRLPITLDAYYTAGLSVAYNPELMIRRAQWDFGASRRRNRDIQVTHSFDAPGHYPVTLTITDQNRNEISQTFHVVVD